MLLLRTLSRLPQTIALLCLILFLMFACNKFAFCAFLKMIYWTSTEVLLNLVAPLDSAVPSLDFEQINVFWTFGFDSVRVAFDTLSVSPNCISRIWFSCSFFWPWENQYLVHDFDSISIAQFPAMICSISAEGSLNRVDHSIKTCILLILSKSFLFILCAFDACSSFSSAQSFLVRFQLLGQIHDIGN